MDGTEKAAAIIFVAAFLTLLGAMFASEYVNMNRILQCQIENKARSSSETALLCGTLKP